MAWTQFLAEFQRRETFYILALAALIMIEWRVPRELISGRSRLRGILFALIGAVVSLLIVDLLGLSRAALGIEIPRVISLPLKFEWAGWTAPLLTAIAVGLVADFWFYWYHRLQHRFLWRFHRVHHSIREMSATNANHHVSEAFFNGLFLLVPASLIAWDYPIIPALVLVQVMLSQYIHSPVEPHFGPFRAVFVDNRFHRIHHSLKPEHFDCNFGGFTTIWDRLFGTAYWPANNEWPAIGVDGVEEPKTVMEWLALPWRN
jgi:sterol desaturase/sphingolipid hydroxylase (fatty acid hydroxylase superfamily)